MNFYKTIISAISVMLPFACFAESHVSSIVSLGWSNAIVWQPSDSSNRKSTAIIVMHSDVDYSDFIANPELADRGFTVIARRPSVSDIINVKMNDVATMVMYARKLPYVKNVVLLGHSGGATIMSAYAMFAHQGEAALEGRLFADYDMQSLNELPAIDGVVLLDPNYGLSAMTLLSLDPNVTVQNEGMNVSERLNLADTAVGYNPKGNSHYAESFIHAFGKAQGQRMNLLTDMALARLTLIKEGKGAFADDEPFVVAGASQVRFNNKLFPQDTLLLNHTHAAHVLLHEDGIESMEIVHTMRSPMRYRDTTPYLSNAANTTVKGFLSSLTIRTNNPFVKADGIEGIEWNSNINTPIGNAAGFIVPLLCMGMTGSWEFISSEMIYDNAASSDKTVVFVEGAGHMIRPEAKGCGDTVKTTFDYMATWLDNRFE